MGSGQKQESVTESVAPAKPITTVSQFAFDFENPSPSTTVQESVTDTAATTARDYQLQMQAYALAVTDLLSSDEQLRIRVTLHFLEPNLEVQLSDELLDRGKCEASIDHAMLEIVSSAAPAEFPVNPASHCRMCNFLSVCVPGREFLAGN
jgi:CRISPR/Cas system-associated exonuclease Cas4 (RecB family)